MNFTRLQPMKNTLLLRNPGDALSEGITDPNAKSILYAITCRALSLLKPGQKIVFPKQEKGFETYLEHVAEFLMPIQDHEKRTKQLQERLFPVNLKKQSVTSKDYLNSLQPEMAEALNGLKLEPYVDGEPARTVAKRLIGEYPERFHETLSSIRHKVHFHHFCVESGLPAIPGSIAAGMEEKHSAQCHSIFQAMQTLFNHGHPCLILRQAIAAGGIGNVRIERLRGDDYHILGHEKTFGSDQGLLHWLTNEFHLAVNPAGMMVAPFYGDGISLSGIAEIREDGKVLVPYLAQEMLNEDGTSFQGVRLDNSLPEDIASQAIDLLRRAGETLKEQGAVGRLQMDMRTVEGRVCAVESNSLRKTAVIEMCEIMAQSDDWITEGHERLKAGKQIPFIGVDHFPISQTFANHIQKVGFYKAFNEIRMHQEQDIGVMLHSAIPLHFLNDKPHIGMICSDEAIRPALGKNKVEPLPESLQKLSLDEKWAMVKGVFQE